MNNGSVPLWTKVELWFPDPALRVSLNPKSGKALVSLLNSMYDCWFVLPTPSLIEDAFSIYAVAIPELLVEVIAIFPLLIETFVLIVVLLLFAPKIKSPNLVSIVLLFAIPTLMLGSWILSGYNVGTIPPILAALVT